jgi:hypothetical protein
MVNAPSLMTAHRAATNDLPVTATASPAMAKVHARLASLTTVVLATMHLAHRATLMHPVHHVVTTTTSSPVPTHTWAPKAA